MKYSTKLSDTVHVMVLIAINQEKSLSSASIAESIHTNPGFVRQLMLKLKKAELMTSVAGHARPSLSKPADQITLPDIYKAQQDAVAEQRSSVLKVSFYEDLIKSSKNLIKDQIK